MWANFSAEKREKDGIRAINFRVNIDNLKVDNVAYEYPPNVETPIPVKFDKVTLRQIVNNYDYIDVDRDPAVITIILKNFFNTILK